MYCTPPEVRKAIKQHICTNCGTAIVKGEQYKRWMSVDDGKAFTNKMHLDCYEDLADWNNGYFEYTPYNGDRPNVG